MEEFCLQLQEIQCVYALILLDDFSHLDICWRSNTSNCKQSMRLLECTNFLVQVIKDPTVGDTSLGLLQKNFLERSRLEGAWGSVIMSW